MSPGGRSPSPVVAIVPMRHHSERIAGKNYRPFAGRPLFHWILDTLAACPEIVDIVVDTDSPTIRAGCARSFPQVRVLERPPELCADDVSMNEILLYVTTRVAADCYVQTHSTNPLLRPETVSAAVQRFQADRARHDSLFSVTRRHVRLWDDQGRAMNHDPAVLVRTQDLEPVFEENSCLYIFTAEVLRARRNRIGDTPIRFEIDPAEAWDIDEAVDFRIAEALMSTREDRA